MQIQTKFVVYREGAPVYLTLVGDYAPGVPAMISGRPEDSTPGELPEAEVTAVYLDQEGNPILWSGKLTDEEYTEAVSKVMADGERF